jgi:hypothetical protein
MNPSSPVPSELQFLRCELATEVLQTSGKLTFQVTGWSMLPTIFPGDTLVVERCSADCTREGDIVLVSRDGRLLVHRLLEKTCESDRPSSIRTRGDSMPTIDPPVNAQQLLGKVSAIERNGKRLTPRIGLQGLQRVVAILVRRSDLAGRVVIGIHNFRQPGRLN